MKDKQIAVTILQQIGGKALYMIGARKKKMAVIKNGVVFKIGRNSKRINKVKITLNSMDTYDIEYWYSAFSMKTLEDKSKLISSDKGIYCDGLKQSIEGNTGMYTNL